MIKFIKKTNSTFLKPVINLAGFFINFTFMKYLIILLLFSCQTYSVHEANLIDQQKFMLKYDEQSRKKQQKIRDSRKKRVKVLKSRNYRKFV